MKWKRKSYFKRRGLSEIVADEENFILKQTKKQDDSSTPKANQDMVKKVNIDEGSIKCKECRYEFLGSKTSKESHYN